MWKSQVCRETLKIIGLMKVADANTLVVAPFTKTHARFQESLEKLFQSCNYFGRGNRNLKEAIELSSLRALPDTSLSKLLTR
jgi:hypothetical protein